MKIVPVAGMKSRFSAYLQECENGPVVVTRNGRLKAVLLSVEDEDDLERLILAYSPKFQAVLDRAKHQIQETGGINHEDFWQEVAPEEDE